MKFSLVLFLVPFWLPAAALAQERPESLRLTIPRACPFYFLIEPAKDRALQAIALSPGESVLWLESTAPKKAALNKIAGIANQAVLRHVQFEPGKTATGELWSKKAPSLSLRNTLVSSDRGLQLEYLDPALGGFRTTKFGWHVAGWKEGEAIGKPLLFAEAALEGTKLVLADGTEKTTWGTLHRAYHFRREGKSGIQLTASYQMTFDAALHQIDIDLPIALPDAARETLLALLAKGKGTVAAASTASVACWWFKDKQTALAFSLGNLERLALTRLLAQIQTDLAGFDVAAPDYKAAARGMKNLAVAQALLTRVKDQFASDEAQTLADIATDLPRLSTRLGQIVYPLALRHLDREWIVYYSVQQRKAHALPVQIDWKPGKDAVLEYVFFNNQNVYFFRLTPTAPLQPKDVADFKKALAAKFGDPGLARAEIAFGLPPRFKVTPTSKAKIASLVFSDAYPDPVGSLHAVAVLERDEAQWLKNVSLKETGLKIDIEWPAGYFAFDQLKTSVVLPGRIFSDRFQVLSQTDGQYAVRVLAAPEIWSSLKGDEREIKLTYGGQEAKIKIKRGSLESQEVVFDRVLTDDNKDLSRLYYQSPVTGAAITVEGPVVILRK